MSAPTAAAEQDPATRAVLIDQAAQIARLTRELYIERARRAHPIPDAALEFVMAADETGIRSQVRRLSALAALGDETASEGAAGLSVAK